MVSDFSNVNELRKYKQATKDKFDSGKLFGIVGLLGMFGSAGLLAGRSKKVKELLITLFSKLI